MNKSVNIRRAVAGWGHEKMQTWMGARLRNIYPLNIILMGNQGYIAC